MADFSPYLAGYDGGAAGLSVGGGGGGGGSGSGSGLAVPGAWDMLPWGPPLAEAVPRVLSFDPRVLTMLSLMKPRRISLRASDGTERRFLAKAGEDLRGDERLQQLFAIANERFAADGVACEARLRVRTFRVVPMSPHHGVLEWVPSTVPLKACLEDQLSKDVAWSSSQGRNQLTASLRKCNLTALPKVMEARRGAVKTLPAAGSTAASAFDPDNAGHIVRLWHPSVEKQAVAAHNAAAALVPATALRGYLQSLAPSPEAFLTLRGEFARSLAALSAVNYAVGLGDRHLENFLLDLSTGQLVGIDFGASFGHGT